MEKRVYRPGYHVNWNNKDKSENTLEASQSQPFSNDVTSDFLQAEPDQSLALSLNENDNSGITLYADIIANRPAKAKSNISYETPSAVQTLPSAEKFSFNRKNHSVLLAPFAKKMGGDNQIVALLLCFFLGMLGVHSFYLGNKKKGIIQLALCIIGAITSPFLIGIPILAALGIWVIIDFIRILIGDLGPGW
jgi:TM2 domain-containing membrane protein YozV